ncbi:MAG: BrnT family toxin [Phascolarctobacterium sp.]|nr:BrnT family toxin [Phascolarctobacterium sp.]
MERKFDSITVYNYNIIIDGLRFEWDENKNSINKRKHKVSFEEAKSVFEDVEALIIDDPEHSEQEERFIIMGFSSKARLLVVCHCYRANETVIRIISARKATERESMQYRAML